MHIENIREYLDDRLSLRKSLDRLDRDRLTDLLIEAWGQLKWLADDIPEANPFLGGKP